jgi:hypothetical protein
MQNLYTNIHIRHDCDNWNHIWIVKFYKYFAKLSALATRSNCSMCASLIVVNLMTGALFFRHSLWDKEDKYKFGHWDQHSGYLLECHGYEISSYFRNWKQIMYFLYNFLKFILIIFYEDEPSFTRVRILASEVLTTAEFHNMWNLLCE